MRSRTRLFRFGIFPGRPSREAFLVEMPAFSQAAEHPVTRAEKPGDEEDRAEDENDGRSAREVVHPIGEDQSGDAAKRADRAAAPKHRGKTVAQKINRRRR